MSRRVTTRQSLIKKLDKVFSTWVRSHDAVDGFQKCFTCHKVAPWKTMDAGHFQSRAKYTTRWTELNVKPQCKHCNLTNGGQQFLFGQRLDFIYGPGTAGRLLTKSNTLTKFSKADLQEMIDEYSARLR